MILTDYVFSMLKNKNDHGNSDKKIFESKSNTQKNPE